LGEKIRTKHSGSTHYHRRHVITADIMEYPVSRRRSFERFERLECRWKKWRS
jgi:hypothetical protein